MTRTNHRGL